MTNWIQALNEVNGRGATAVLVTVASIKGSTPREPGAKMVVSREAIHGTIGGGHLEFKAIEIARDMLANGGVNALHRFPLGASLGQCCGGLVNLLFEPVCAGARWVDTLLRLATAGTDCVLVTPVRGDATEGRMIVTAGAQMGTLGSVDECAAALARQVLVEDGGARIVTLADELQTGGTAQFFVEPVRLPDFHIVLFGAGHVGRALVKVLADLRCCITWVDPRDDQFPDDIPANVSAVVTDTPEAEITAAPAGAYFLVMTHSHPLDQALAEQILRRTDFAYFGLIGSLSKRRQFERRMAARGITPARFAEMTCPIGAAGISDKQPIAIAIAVAAELLQIRERLEATQQRIQTRRA